MKISIDRATLLKAVGQAQSVVERLNTMPILANVLIEAEGGDIIDKVPHHEYYTSKYRLSSKKMNIYSWSFFFNVE